MQRFGAILLFYKPFYLWSFAINIAITVVNPHIFPAIITKLFLIIFLWYFLNETHNKRKLIFYKNLGLSMFHLFLALFIIDALITIMFILLIQEFI